MTLFMFITAIVAIGIIIYFIKFRFQRNSNIPLAKGCWPLIGHILSIDKKAPRHSLFKFSKVVGPIFRVRFGPQEVIVLAGFEVVKEALKTQGDKFIFRQRDFITAELPFFGKHGIIFTDGEVWKEQRRFTLHVFRDFGFGTQVMEHRIIQELDKMCAWINEEIENGQGECILDTQYPLKFCIGNIISSLLLGRSFNRTDKELHEMQTAMDNCFHVMASSEFLTLNFLPWLKKIPLSGHFGWDNIVEATRVLDKYWRRVYTECKMKYDPKTEPTCYMEAFIHEMEKRKQLDDKEMGTFTDEQLIGNIGDLWVAGMETTTHTLNWLILYMLHYPEIQEKIYQEIVNICGKDKPLTVTDRQHLAYTNAALIEVQRITSVADVTGAHLSHERTNLLGYTVEPETPVLCSLYSVHMDEDIFPNADKFEPERYLEADRKTLQKDMANKVIPFGMGKRMCLGENLARMQIFLIGATMLRNYKFTVIPGTEKPTLEPIVSLTTSPQHFNCLITAR